MEPALRQWLGNGAGVLLRMQLWQGRACAAIGASPAARRIASRRIVSPVVHARCAFGARVRIYSQSHTRVAPVAPSVQVCCAEQQCCTVSRETSLSREVVNARPTCARLAAHCFAVRADGRHGRQARANSVRQGNRGRQPARGSVAECVPEWQAGAQTDGVQGGEREQR